MREARELREAIMNMGDSKGLDEEGAYVFTRVLGTRSVAQLQATLNCYKQKYGQEISRDLEKECGGELEDAIRTCVECFYRPSRYYAQLLYEAMKGVGADDLTLIRVITTRAEVDMESIKAEFHGLYHKSLAQAIRSEQAMANPLKSFFLVVVDATRDGAVKAATKMPSQKMQNA
eukprot:Gb_06463 [translate_table: standard]